jgi:hypothetical protein
MNSTLIQIYRFRKKVNNTKKENSHIVIADLTSEVRNCLEDGITGTPLEELLFSRYICPFQFNLYQENNLDKLADSITKAILMKPNSLTTFRVAKELTDEVKDFLMQIINQRFGQYVKIGFRKINNQTVIDFVSN